MDGPEEEDGQEVQRAEDESDPIDLSMFRVK